MTRRRRAGPIMGLLAVLGGCRASDPRVQELTIEDPQAWWFGGEFAPMVAPVRVPSPEREAEQVEVWLALPDTATIGVEHDADQVPRLRFGAGTRADRIEWNSSAQGRRIVDVRGTYFDDAGRCTHHVLRPLDDRPGGALFGLQWPCDEPGPAAEATARMREWLAGRPEFAEMPAQRRTRVLDGFVAHNDCDGCHVEARPDATTLDALGPVARGTDASGFFAPPSVLRDAIPLETYGAFDPNVGDPALEIDCGGPAPEMVEPRHGVTRWRCPESRVPVAKIDWARARRSDPARVAAICASRTLLWTHLDAPGRAAFAGVMNPC